MWRESVLVSKLDALLLSSQKKSPWVILRHHHQASPICSIPIPTPIIRFSAFALTPIRAKAPHQEMPGRPLSASPSLFLFVNKSTALH